MGDSILPVLLDALDDHLGGPWEAAFRDQLRRMAATGQLGEGVVAIGPFWTDNGQHEIDAVALAGRARRPVLAGEAKWARSVGAPRIVADLARKAAALPDHGDDMAFAVCARNEVRDVPAGVIAITSAEIFA